jgi:hypothetical protein
MQSLFTFACVLSNLVWAASARAEYEHDRRRELLAMTAAADLSQTPAAMLTWPTPFRPKFNEAKRAALVEDVLRVERLVSGRMNLTRVEVREALDLVLRPSAIVPRALSGRLNQHGLNRFGPVFREVALEMLRQSHPEVAGSLDVGVDPAELRAGVVADLGLFDWRGHQWPLTFGFRDDSGLAEDFSADAWRFRRPEMLIELARAHVRARLNLERARARVARLARSPLRDLSLEVLREVDASLVDQLFDLPARAGRMIELTEGGRRGTQQRPYRDAWASLGSSEPRVSDLSWRATVQRLAAEGRAHARCTAGLSN